jgi:DNA-directed RNA polymerase specialized sigma subunit
MFEIYQTFNANDQESREIKDLLRNRIKLLDGKDKLLMTMYLEKGNSFRQMAALAGIGERNISRRVRKLTKRLIEGEFITCVQNSDKFTANELAVAQQYFLTGLSIREISEKQRITNYNVRKILRKIRQVIADIREGKN